MPFGRYKKPYFPEAELYHFAEKASKPQVLLRILRRVHASVRTAAQWCNAIHPMRR
ncbi:hypothetical protein MJK72_26575 [Klebsiella pneumoniae]|nr:hypothetical protein MJK72_26575 [Klebsiella pneumoniae]